MKTFANTTPNLLENNLLFATLFLQNFISLSAENLTISTNLTLTNLLIPALDRPHISLLSSNGDADHVGARGNTSSYKLYLDIITDKEYADDFFPAGSVHACRKSNNITAT